MFFTNIYDVAVQYTLVYTSEPESDGDIYMVKVYKISKSSEIRKTRDQIFFVCMVLGVKKA